MHGDQKHTHTSKLMDHTHYKHHNHTCASGTHSPCTNTSQTYHICSTYHVHVYHTHYINMPYTHTCTYHIYIIYQLIPYMLHIQIYNIVLTGTQHMPYIYAHTTHMQIYISIILHRYHTDYRTQTYHMLYIPQIHLTLHMLIPHIPSAQSCTYH